MDVDSVSRRYEFTSFSFSMEREQMGSEDRSTFNDVEPRVWQHIRQAGSAGLGFRQLVAETGLSFDVVLGAVLSHYTRGDIQCFVESDDLRCVAS